MPSDPVDDDKDYYEDLGPVVPLHRIKGLEETGNQGFLFAFSEHKAKGSVDGVKFEVSSNVDGSIVIEFGEESVDKGYRYIVKIRDAVETAYRHHKTRKGG